MTAQSSATANKPHSRDPNLDLLRAAAILGVVVFHLAYASPAIPEKLRNYLQIGKSGVDLLFVLSGWLIGGIYWREWHRNGSVKLWRFWARRWMRTLPPYLGALVLSWLSVNVERQVPFDFGFLLFLQNYYPAVPFFKASWSLCVEEHFYLLLPWVLMLFTRLRALGVAVALLIPLGLPQLRTLYVHQANLQSVGFIESATHLRCEGMALGVLASGIACLRPEIWRKVKRVCRWIAAPVLIVLLSMSLWPDDARYVIGYSIQALGWIVILAAVESAKPLPTASSKSVFWVASTAYSIYLMNIIALHASEFAGHRFRFIDSFAFPVVAAVVIGAVSTIFYYCFERSSILLRERIAPNRISPGALKEAAAASHL